MIGDVGLEMMKRIVLRDMGNKAVGDLVTMMERIVLEKWETRPLGTLSDGD